jgi:hypothetical protein
MNRRHPVVGDIVVIDYEDLNAITICTKIIEHETDENQYVLSCLAGLAYSDGKISNFEGDITLYDDYASMSIVGVNGFSLPETFYGLDTRELLLADGFKF